MTLEELFELRKKMPELSGNALILLALIEFRMQITTNKDKQGKFIYLTGLNDPRQVLGFSKDQFDRAKRELKNANLLVIKKQGAGRAGKVYLTLEKYTSKKVKSQKCYSKSAIAHSIPETSQKCDSKHRTSATSLPIYRDNCIENRKENKGIPASKVNFLDALKVLEEREKNNEQKRNG